MDRDGPAVAGTRCQPRVYRKPTSALTPHDNPEQTSGGGPWRPTTAPPASSSPSANATARFFLLLPSLSAPRPQNGTQCGRTPVYLRQLYPPQRGDLLRPALHSSGLEPTSSMPSAPSVCSYYAWICSDLKPSSRRILRATVWIHRDALVSKIGSRGGCSALTMGVLSGLLLHNPHLRLRRRPVSLTGPLSRKANCGRKVKFYPSLETCSGARASGRPTISSCHRTRRWSQ
ncbi:hypothetical protein C4D60_Mb00t19110 [Musa balbisiana]|uniref:Uncharacterized protein n=1 Tax=Musa balbisiana TaxID=52838 RepID=A0A4S8I3B1_MUSBA|nr:hypothetical protein C4D60_Mb00t19110 [Musa balbisiana]